jgi:hypothetical protein
MPLVDIGPGSRPMTGVMGPALPDVQRPTSEEWGARPRSVRFGERPRRDTELSSCLDPATRQGAGMHSKSSINGVAQA